MRSLPSVDAQFDLLEFKQAISILNFYFIAITILTLLIALFLVLDSHAATMPDYTDGEIVSAIYQIEGGVTAKKPFGVLSVKCMGYLDCKEICHNTVRNNRKRFAKQSQEKDFLSFLAKRYAPVGAGNDPRGLNKNWEKNLRMVLAKQEK